MYISAEKDINNCIKTIKISWTKPRKGLKRANLAWGLYNKTWYQRRCKHKEIGHPQQKSNNWSVMGAIYGDTVSMHCLALAKFTTEN